MKRFLPAVIIFFVIFFAFLAGFALLSPGLPPTHDGEYHVVRFYEFDKMLRDGNIYPRWAPDLNKGYGIPLFNYVYPLPNYFASFLHFFGFSFIDAFKLSMFVATIVGAVFFYLWARMVWGDLGGIVSSVFYSFSPYRFVDIYIRGSVGEVWALAFFPALLWSIHKFFYKKGRMYILYASLFLAAIIFSHNILGLIFLFFAISYIVFLICQSKDKKYFILNTLCLILLGIGLSSIFWLPALFERNFVRGLQIYDVVLNFPELYQLLFPSWGSGFSASDLQNQMSFQIGIGNLSAIILAIAAGLMLFKKQGIHKFFVIYFLVWFAFVLFLMLKISLPVWRHVPLMNYFQFPWRLLSLEILIASFLAGSIFRIVASKMLAFGMILGVIILTIGYTRPAYYHQRNDEYYIMRSNFIDGTNSAGNVFNTIWFNRNLRKQKDKITFKNNSAEVKTQSLTATNYAFNIVVKDTTEAIINTAYFPGWTVFINNNKLDTKPNKDGIITFIIPKGEYVAEVKFLDTALRKIATTVSLVSLLVILTLFVFVKKNYVKIKR